MVRINQKRYPVIMVSHLYSVSIVRMIKWSIIYLLIFIWGCAMSQGEQLTRDLENSYISAHEKGGNQEARKAAVTNAAKKYFPPRMKTEDAFALLKTLKQDGFEVSEYRHEGARSWPDGELKEYSDDATRRNMKNRYAKGESGFTAKKKYGTKLLIINKHAVISFRVADGSGEISNVEGDVWVDSI